MEKLLLLLILLIISISLCTQFQQEGTNNSFPETNRSTTYPQQNQTQQNQSTISLTSQPKTVQQPPSCCSHPYYHSVWRATSNDGKNWIKEGRLLIDHASVPHPTQLANGSIVVYYVNGSIDTFDCSITDDGVNYRYGDCKLFNYTTQKAWDPYVIKLDNGKYRLFFFGPEQGDPGQLPPFPPSNKIYSALSNDGINFFQESGVRFQETGITDPAVIFVNGTWKMYSAKGSNVVVATSTDSYSFTKVGEYNTRGSVPDILKFDDGSLLLFICRNGISYITPPEISGSVESATVAISGEPNTIICDPGITRLNDENYVMYYKKQK